MTDVPEFSDEDVAVMLEGLARKLESGDINQSEAALRLVRLSRSLNGVTSYEGRVKSQGRVSFGRPNEGRDGIAVFVADEAPPGDTHV